MKNKRIIQAYDTVTPRAAQTAKMLDAILAEADLKEQPRKIPRNPNVRTMKPGKKRRTSPVLPLVAALAMVLAAGCILVRLARQPEVPVTYADPIQTMTAEKTAGDHYAPVIDKYNQAIAQGWTKEQCEIDGISPRVQAGYDVTKAGYAFLDLDGDGREELIIAEESTSRTDNIWDLYTTLEDGTPIQLWVDDLEGGQCKLCEDNVISISYSMKDELEQTFYKLESGQLSMLGQLQWEDEDTVFHTDAEGNTHGGCVVFETQTTAHIQYIASTPYGREHGALDGLFARLIQEVYAHKQWLDFGVSVEQGGAILNEGLVMQTEGFGARAFYYATWEIIV